MKVIALWMGYVVVTGAAITLAAWLLELLAHNWRLPSRGIWMSAMLMMLALGSAAALATMPALQRTSPEMVLAASDTRNVVVESVDSEVAATGIDDVRLRGARVIS